MGSIYLRKYGVATTVDFCLYELDGTDLQTGAVHASGDSKIMKDEGAEANTANAFVDEGTGYSLALTATEMTAARIVVYIVDQTSPKAWLDKVLIIETYGNASAQHPFDLASATVNLSSTTETQIDTIQTQTDKFGFDASSYVNARVKATDDIDLSATQKASVNTETDNALNTAIPGSPTANSMNERIKTMDDNLPSDPADESLLETEINANETKIDALQTDLTAIKKILKNKWKILNNQLIIYDDDGSTPLYTFNLSGEQTTAYSERSPV